MRLQFAQASRQLGDDALAKNDRVQAIWNYRQAMMAAPRSPDGIAASRAIRSLEQQAATALKEVNHLLAAKNFARAFERIDELAREYSNLQASAKIEQARRRTSRLQKAAEGVGDVPCNSKPGEWKPRKAFPATRPFNRRVRLPKRKRPRNPNRSMQFDGWPTGTSRAALDRLASTPDVD